MSGLFDAFEGVSLQIDIKSFIMNHSCATHPKHHVLLICLEPKCQENRLCCLLCVDDSHNKHELVSIQCFHRMMEDNLQVNRKNPDKHHILKDLNKSKAEIMNRLENMKNKLIGLVGACEDKVEQYYSRIYHSFAVDSHHMMVKDIETHFTSEKVSTFIKMMKDFENIALGTIGDTQNLMYASLAIFKEKLSQTQKNCQAQLESLKQAFNQVSFAKPKEFLYQFSRDRRQNALLSLSDSQTSVMRTNGSGGYPMCLLQTPFDPINKSVSFTIDKTDGNKKSICLGVCLQNVVKTNNFSNCGGGLNKGIYAIDQNCPFNTEESMIASWNHHDPQFNQTNVGSNNIIGWTFTEGDQIRVEVDYYNSNVIFIKGNEEEWQDDDEEVKIYEMPVRLNAGPLYAFVSCQNKGDKVTIKR